MNEKPFEITNNIKTKGCPVGKKYLHPVHTLINISTNKSHHRQVAEFIMDGDGKNRNIFKDMPRTTIEWNSGLKNKKMGQMIRVSMAGLVNCDDEYDSLDSDFEGKQSEPIRLKVKNQKYYKAYDAQLRRYKKNKRTSLTFLVSSNHALSNFVGLEGCIAISFYKNPKLLFVLTS